MNGAAGPQVAPAVGVRQAVGAFITVEGGRAGRSLYCASRANGPVAQSPDAVSMSQECPPSLDPIAAGRWARRAPLTDAHGHPRSPWLHEEVARRMAERLPWIRHQPTRWVHWGPLSGGLQTHAQVARLYPQAPCDLVEDTPARAALALRALQPPAPPWWRLARPATPPLAAGEPPPGTAGLVWANMQLHSSPAPQTLLRRWQQALAPDGFLMMSCLGPDTLRGLRRLYARLGWPEPAHAFTDMHDWGDMLVKAGFAEPVMDMEHLELRFETPQRLLQELRELGRNLHVARFPALRGRGWQQALLDALEAGRRPDGGGLVLGFEIVYGHAFKAPPRLAVQAETQVSLDQMRQTLLQRKKNLPPV